MDPEKPSSPRRKMKFLPKPPKRRAPRSVKPKKITLCSEADAEAQEAAEAEALRKHINENSRKDKPKAIRKAQVSFGPGANTHYVTRSSSRDGTGSGSSAMRRSDSGEEQKCNSLKLDQNNGMLLDGAETSDSDIQDQEPWDTSTFYPITLPLRKPYSGNPDILNEAEFGENAKQPELNESTVNDAAELGLLDSVEGQGESPKLMLFQFPESLPVPSIKQTASAKGKEIAVSSNSPGAKGSKPNMQREAIHSRFPGAPARNCTSLDKYPTGHVGKLLVYKSGAVKLKLGDGKLFNVWAGQDSTFAQDVVGINTKDKNCCVVGQVEKKAVVAPDVDSILSSIE